MVEGIRQEWIGGGEPAGPQGPVTWATLRATLQTLSSLPVPREGAARVSDARGPRLLETKPGSLRLQAGTPSDRWRGRERLPRDPTRGLRGSLLCRNLAGASLGPGRLQKPLGAPR